MRVMRIGLVAFGVVCALRSPPAPQQSPADGIKVCHLQSTSDPARKCLDIPVARVVVGEVPQRSEDQEFAFYGSCRNLTPNYLSHVTLSRWQGARDRLGIAVSVSVDRSLSGVATVSAHYLEGARTGAGVWATALSRWNKSFLDIRVRRDDPSAHIKITIEDSASPSNDRAEAETRVQYERIGPRPVIANATIVLHRGGRSGLRAAERLMAQGTWTRWHFESLVGELVAHEMGHALGIRGHSGDPADLMHSGGRADPRLDPGSWITRADVNTLWLAYCGESTGPARQVETAAAFRRLVALN